MTYSVSFKILAFPNANGSKIALYFPQTPVIVKIPSMHVLQEFGS